MRKNQQNQKMIISLSSQHIIYGAQLKTPAPKNRFSNWWLNLHFHLWRLNTERPMAPQQEKTVLKTTTHGLFHFTSFPQ